MKISEYRQFIFSPFSESSPYGESVTEESSFDFIETQLMKVGSLAHEEIEWNKVESSCLQLLGKTGKDFKVLSSLIQTLQYQSTPERYNLSLAILADFVNAFWESPHPFKGARGLVAKKRLMSQIIERSLRSFDQIENPYDTNDKKELAEYITLVEEGFTLHKLDDVEWDKLKGLLTRINDVNNHEKSTKVESLDVSSDAAHSTEYASIPQTKVVFDSSDERTLKRTLNQIIHFLDEMKETLLVVKIRRLALWHTINMPPQGNESGETELAAVPIDKISEYKEGIINPNEALWEKIEHSISLSPFWLDGHYLSYQVAHKLGFIEESLIIKKELQAFIKKVPSIINMSFKGNIPFLSYDTQKWLEESIDYDGSIEKDKSSHEEIGQISEMQSEIMFATDLQDKALNMLNKKGLEETIHYLNEGFTCSTTLREACYWKLALAGVYSAKGLSALADTLYESVTQVVNETSVKEWETDLVQKLLHITEESKIVI